jgi:uncharacterized protein YodC (DUF2158 family)
METMIKAGDVVRLLTGGPKMTVERVDGAYKSPRVFCVWFDVRLFNESGGRLSIPQWGELRRGEFAACVLASENDDSTGRPIPLERTI